MVRKWACGTLGFVFLLTSAIGFGQDAELVFARTGAGGNRKASGDYEIVARVSIAETETAFAEAEDYSIAPLEAYQAPSSAIVNLWVLY